ncbi:hypothetical protein ACFLZF_00015 [Nanoarchaeota archaeon]
MKLENLINTRKRAVKIVKKVGITALALPIIYLAFACKQADSSSSTGSAVTNPTITQEDTTDTTTDTTSDVQNYSPKILGLALSEDVSADSTAIYTNWDKNIEGRVVATDSDNSSLNYTADVSGDGLIKNWNNYDEFSIEAKQSNSTDATTDLGYATFSACDDATCDTKTMKVVGYNPIKTKSWLEFHESGANILHVDVTSDNSNLWRLEGYKDGELLDSGAYDYATNWDKISFPTLTGEGLNTTMLSFYNLAGDKKDVVYSFTTTTENKAIQTAGKEFDKYAITYYTKNDGAKCAVGINIPSCGPNKNFIADVCGTTTDASGDPIDYYGHFGTFDSDSADKLENHNLLECIKNRGANILTTYTNKVPENYLKEKVLYDLITPTM